MKTEEADQSSIDEDASKLSNALSKAVLIMNDKLFGVHAQDPHKKKRL